MAGGFMDFTAATALSADVDTFLMRQTIMRFADQTEMMAEMSGYEEEGMFFYTLDENALWRYTGTGYTLVNSPPIAYTPTWTNLTVGDGVVVARVGYVGDLVRARGQITFGSTTAVTGNIQQDIPYGLTSDAAPSYGTGLGNDADGSRIYPFLSTVAPADDQIGFVHAETGGVVNATSPFTWATGDVLAWDITIGV